MMIDDYYSSFMAILAQHITYEFAVRVQRQCDGQGEPFELNLFHIFDPLCLMSCRQPHEDDDNHYDYHYYYKNDNQKVATRPADNPMGMMARKVGWSNGVAHSAPRLSLPGKFVCCLFSLVSLLDIIVFVIFYSHLQASWCSPPLTQLDTSQCSVLAMW